MHGEPGLCRGKTSAFAPIYLPTNFVSPLRSKLGFSNDNLTADNLCSGAGDGVYPIKVTPRQSDEVELGEGARGLRRRARRGHIACSVSARGRAFNGRAS